MDFLDPQAKRLRTLRLMTGYVLLTILILTLSTILVFRAYGFDVDRSTGEVIQNGLVYIDSAPDDAAIYVNGSLYKDRTNTRLTLAEGTYDIEIRKDGYRDWKRSLDIKGGNVQRLVYPLLVLNDHEQREIANYGATRPILTTQSPDRRWLIVSKASTLNEFIEYDLNNIDTSSAQPEQRPFSVPLAIFTQADGSHTLEEIEWSTDNDHSLIKHTYTGGFEYVVISRKNPDTSFNINKLLGVTVDDVNLRDKKFNEWYIYRKDGGLLQIADTKKSIVPAFTGVTAFKTHDETVVLYAQTGVDGNQDVYLRQNNETHLIRSVKSGEVKLEIARYDGSWYAVIGSSGDRKAYIYKDPLKVVNRLKGLKPAPVAVLHADNGLDQVAFSTNTRFIMAQNGQHIGTYDAERDEMHSFDVSQPFDEGTKLKWMDGHRMIARSDGTIMIFDFDGSNVQKIIKAYAGNATYFDRDYTVLYSLNSSQTTPDTSALVRSNLRFEQDK